MFAVWDSFTPLVPSKSLRFRVWVSLRVSLFFFLPPLPFYSQFPIHKALYTIHGNPCGHRLEKDYDEHPTHVGKAEGSVQLCGMDVLLLKKNQVPKVAFLCERLDGQGLQLREQHSLT